MFDENAFRAAMVIRGVSMKQLAGHLGIDVSTLYRKIKDSGSFTRKEINEIIDYLGIDDPKAIFFTNKLA